MKKARNLSTAIAGCLLLGGATTPAVAEQAIVLPQMSVVSTKTPRQVFTTPASLSVVDTAEIELVNPDGYVDLLQAVPGVAIQGGARRIAETPVIRGFSDEQVVIRTDGARRNFDQGHRGRFPVDPSLIKRVEVLRGPGSGLYGSGSLGGVIDITTKSALDYLDEDGAGGEVGLGYRSNGSEASGILTGFGRSGAVDILGSAVLRNRGEDLVDGDDEDILATEDEVQSFFGKIGYAPSQDQRLEIILDDFTNTGINPPNANEAATATSTLVDRDTERQSFRLSWSDARSDNDAIDLDAVFYLNDSTVRESRLDDPRLDETEQDTMGFEVRNTTIIGASGNRLTYGVEYYRDQQTGDRDGTPRPQFPDAEAAYLAGFVQGEFEFDNGLSLIPSLRFDSFEMETDDGTQADRDDSHVSPALGIGYAVNESNFLWGKVANAFRAPSLTELYADGVHFVAPIGRTEVVINEFVPNPDLEPEESTSIELGYRRRMGDLVSAGDQLTFSATVFHNDVKNYVDQRVTFISGPPSFDRRSGSLVFPGTTTNESVDATIEGIELELDYQSRHWFGQLSVSTVDTEIDDSGVGLASAPPDKFVATIGRRLNDGATRVGTRLTYAGNQHDVPDDTTGTDAYTLVDLFGDHVLGNGLRIGFGISNVLDETYAIHPTPIHQPGRSFNLTFSMPF